MNCRPPKWLACATNSPINASIGVTVGMPLWNETRDALAAMRGTPSLDENGGLQPPFLIRG